MEKLTERCLTCGLFAGDLYGTGYYRLADKVYCSLNCFNDHDKASREVNSVVKNTRVAKKKKRAKVKRRK